MKATQRHYLVFIRHARNDRDGAFFAILFLEGRPPLTPLEPQIPPYTKST